MSHSTRPSDELAYEIVATKHAYLRRMRQNLRDLDKPPGGTARLLALLELAVDQCLATFDDPADALDYMRQALLAAQPPAHRRLV